MEWAEKVTVVAAAIREADGDHTMGAGELAEVAVGALALAELRELREIFANAMKQEGLMGEDT